jgi:DNA mismatch repair protein MSH6
MDDFEASTAHSSPSRYSSPVKPKPSSRGKFVPPKTVTKKPTTSWNRPSSPEASDGPAASSPNGRQPTRPSTTQPTSNRPGPRPSASSFESGHSSSSSPDLNSSADAWLRTKAERKREQAKEDNQKKDQPFEFLDDDKIMDMQRRRPDDPDYDGRTVYIPKKCWDKFTPFEEQFWKIKQEHYDTVLFFQKGKFFELYESDAQIGANQFDLHMTDRVKMKMVSFPSPHGPATHRRRSGCPNRALNSGQLSSLLRASRWEKWSKPRRPLGEFVSLEYVKIV